MTADASTWGGKLRQWSRRRTCRGIIRFVVVRRVCGQRQQGNIKCRSGKARTGNRYSENNDWKFVMGQVAVDTITMIPNIVKPDEYSNMGADHSLIFRIILSRRCSDHSRLVGKKLNLDSFLSYLCSFKKSEIHQ